MNQKQNSVKWLTIIGAVIAILTGAMALGFAMPWETADIALKKAVAIEVNQRLIKLEECCTTCEKNYAVIDGKLDILINRVK